MFNIVAATLAPVLNAFSQERTNQMSTDAANNQMNFQRETRANSHQTEVRDLQAAGLNPILSAGGSGAGTSSGASPALSAPQINLPDILSYGISLKQLEQADQKIAIDKANSAAAIAKGLTEQDLNKMKKIMLQKGMIRAELEGEASGVLRNILNFMKKSTRTPGQPGTDSATDRIRQDFPGMSPIDLNNP